MSKQNHLTADQLKEIDSRLSLLIAHYEISNYIGQLIISSLIHDYECMKESSHLRTVDAYDSTFEELNYRYYEYLINCTDYFSVSSRGF